MAKALLISYAGYPESASSLMPDNGLASLAASLIAHGHEVKILDYATTRAVAELVPAEISRELAAIYDTITNPSTGKLAQFWHFTRLQMLHKRLEAHQTRQMQRYAQELSDLVAIEKPDFVGFKLWMGDGFTGAGIMTRQLRKDHPRLMLFGGGPHAYSFKSRIFDYLPLDAICYDEGEETIVQLADYSVGTRRLETIPNLFLSNGITTPLEKITDLDSLPLPVYDADVYPAMADKLPLFVIDETRGCAFSCPFCIQSSRMDNRYRAKSAGRIADEIERLVKQHKMRLFRFGGQMTTGRIFNEVAQLILERELAVRYSAFAHVNAMTGAELPLLKQSGLDALFFGVESGSQRLLDDIFHKQTSVAKIKETLIATRAAGIDTVASFIHPAPFEDKESRQATLDLIRETRPSSVLAYFPGLYPDAGWDKDKQRFGFDITTNDYPGEVMTYKVKSMFPPRFWSPLPYRINGKPFRQYAGETERFVKEAALLTTVFGVDEHFVMAKYLNRDAARFIKELRRMFYSGDVNAMESLKAGLYENNG